MTRKRILYILLLISHQLFAQTVQHGPDEVYYATDVVEGRDGRLFLSTTGGVYYTDDDGDSWHRPDHHHNSIYVEPVLAIDKRTGNLYCADADPFIMYSADNGETFSALTFDFPVGDHQTQAMALDGDTLWIGTSKGLLYSSELEWDDNNEPRVISALTGKSVTSLYVEKKLVIAGTSDAGVYLSTDGGVTWGVTSNGLPANFPVTGILVHGTRWYAYGIMGLYYSDDRGASWHARGSSLAASPILDLVAVGDALYACTETYDNVWQLDGGSETWQLIDNGVPVAYGAMKFIWADNDDMLVGGWRGIYKRHSPDLTFAPAYTGITDAFAVDMLDEASDGTLWAIATNTGIYSKVPGEDTFKPFMRDVTYYGCTPLLGDTLAVVTEYRLRFYDVITGTWKGEYPFVNIPFARTFAKAWGGMYLSSMKNGVFKYNGTDTWQPFSTGLSNLAVSNLVYHRGRLLAATDDGLYTRDSDDTQWTRVPFYGNGQATGVRAMLAEGDLILVSGLNNLVYMSRDNGLTWSSVEDLEFSYAASFSSYNGRIYAGGHSDLFVSSPDKSTWKAAGLGVTAVRSVLVVDERLYAGTIERGIWSIPLSRFTREKQVIDISAIPTNPHVGEPFTLQATATSGLPVIFGIIYGPAQIEDDYVATIVRDEEVIFIAEVAGNDTYEPAILHIKFTPMNILGIEDEADGAFAVYPVPAQSQLFVKGPAGGEASVKLLDGQGRTWLSKNFVEQTELQVSDLAAGLYMVMVERKGRAPVCKRIVKK